MNKYEENVYKNLFEYPTKKIVELELENEKLQQENQQLKKQKDDVVEYIKSNCIVSDEWTELDFCNFVPTGKVNYKP